MTRTYRLTLTANGYRVLRTPAGNVYITGPRDLKAADPLAGIPAEDRQAVADLIARPLDDWSDQAQVLCGTDSPSEVAAKAEERASWQRHERLMRDMDDPDSTY